MVLVSKMVVEIRMDLHLPPFSLYDYLSDIKRILRKTAYVGTQFL